MFRCAVPSAPSASPLRFAVESCLCEPLPGRRAEPDPGVLPTSPREGSHARSTFLNWRRSSTNPFASEWERILAWVNTHPAQNTRDLFVELQQVFPGRYQASQYSALQRAVRKIRAHLRKRAEEPWPIEIIHGVGSSPVPEQGSPRASSQEDTTLSAARSSALLLSQAPVDVPSFPCPVAAREEKVSGMAIGSGKPVESHHHTAPTLSPQASRSPAFSVLTIAPLIQSFLQERKGAGREEKTIEWHQRALRSLQQYLAHQEKDVLEALTTAVVRDWLAGLCSESSETGTARSSSTINAYARSARAFCHWLVLQGYLECTPFVKGTVPKATNYLAYILTPEAFEHLLRVCGPSGDLIDHATARNRALLWLFWETGLLVTEVCGLRVWDVDREQGQVRIQGPDSKARWVPVGAIGWHALLCYLDHFRLGEAKETAGEEVLFLSERGLPLTLNAVTLLFPRLSSRAGMRGKGVSPSLLRDTFAVRYLQQGGHLKTLQKLLGLASRAALKRYQNAARSLPHQPSALGSQKNKNGNLCWNIGTSLSDYR